MVENSKKTNLFLRSLLLMAIREFFTSRNYLEVETPYRVPTQAPEAHIEAEICGGWYLQTSPEICMKRLLAAGYSRIFQICKCFRKGERGLRHLPEMTMLEWYRAPSDYNDLMHETEALVKNVAINTGLGKTVQFEGNSIDLAGPWDKMTVREAFYRYAGISPEKALSDEHFDEIMAFSIEPQLGLKKPVFLHDYPLERAALARRRTDNPKVAERCELYIGGLELSNAFSELTDPIEQRNRFEKELQSRKNSGLAVYPMPEKFLTALEGMPKAAGSALGIDRLVMLFAGTDRIDDVVAFTPEEL